MKKQIALTLPSPRKVFSTFLFFITITVLSFMFCKLIFAESLTLAWDPNTESDLAGYKIYYNTTSQDAPFDGTGIEQGNSPITVGIGQLSTSDAPAYQLNNLAAGTKYFFTVSAYNTSGIESEKSNVVSHEVQLSIISNYFLIPVSELSIFSVDSEELVGEDGAAENAIDGNPDTIWHTEWYSSDPQCPHEIVIDLGSLYHIGEIQYMPRQDSSLNGAISKYEIYISRDASNWEEPVAQGFLAADSSLKEISFSEKTGQYVRFVALAEVNGKPWTSAAEFNVLGIVPADTDNDGIIDWDETNLYGSDPTLVDSDADGVLDGDELAYWGYDWDLDSDQDGTINLLDWDADGDGASDGQEIEAGTDPLVFDVSTPEYSFIPVSELSIFSVDSEELVGEDGAAENAIDGNPDTIWHTEWYSSDPQCPHEIVIDLGSLYHIGEIQYMPRQDSSLNGAISKYEIYISRDASNWEEPVAQGFLAADSSLKEISFSEKTGQYVRFVALAEVNGKPWTSAAEFNVLGIVPADTDNDGIIDWDETNLYGSDPTLVDSDADGVLDGDELAYWGYDWDLDSDQDGTINLLDWDADGDGASDGQEIEAGTDPLVFDVSTPEYSFIPVSELSIFSVDSEELVGEDGAAENAIDGNPDTIWHTEWYSSDPQCPHEIVIDLGSLYHIGEIQYMPRQDSSLNGAISKYEIYISRDASNWEEPVAQGFLAADSSLKEISFSEKTGQYVRFVALAEVNGKPWTSAAEFNVIAR